jgi:predicted GTPase
MARSISWPCEKEKKLNVLPLRKEGLGKSYSVITALFFRQHENNEKKCLDNINFTVILE